MQRDPKVYLKDILRAVEKIDNYVENLGFKEFSANEIVQDAVVRNLRLLGLETF